MEWRWSGPALDIPADSSCFTMEISSQQWRGYYLGDGIYAVRYSSKTPETGSYFTSSDIPELNGLSGQFVSIAPWPGKSGKDDFMLGGTWFTDRPDPQLFMGVQQGALSVAKFRREFLSDWTERWEWLD
jgi:hypothetical protein